MACVLGLLAAAISITPAAATTTATIAFDYTSPTSGAPGTSIYVDCTGFTPNEQAILYYDAALTQIGTAPATVNTTGTFIISGRIPTNATPGNHYIQVSTTPDAANILLFNVIIPTTFTLSPIIGNVGETISVTGSGFTPGLISLYWNGATSAFVSITADSSGILSGTFTVPTTPKGTYTITTSSGYGSANFQVNPKIVINPATGGVGDAVGLTGTGFAANSTVIISVATQTISTTSPSPIPTTATGSFSCTFAIPSIPGGINVVQATDGIGNSAVTNFTTGPKISVSPATGGVGDNIIISGSGFSPFKPITFTIDGVALTVSPSTVTSDLNGAFSNVSFVIPPVSGGTHSIKATDQDGHNNTATLTMMTKITVTPTTGTVGTQITVTGSGFAPSTPVSIYWDAGASPVTNVTSSSTGTISGLTFNAPPSAKGVHTVKAQDTSNNSATVSFSTTPKIVLTPATGGYGDSITISYTGFTAGSTITTTSLLISSTVGVPLGTTPTTVAIDANGNGSATFSVINIANGTWTIQATDNGSASAQATLAVTQKISLNNSSGAAGDIVVVTGTGFAPNKGITLKYNGQALSITPSPVTSDTNGAFACQFTVPATSAGAIPLTASDGNNVATLSFNSVDKATISISTTKSNPGWVGMSLTINGTGFKPNKDITVTFASAPVTVALVNSDAGGSFTATFKVPAAPSGNHTISASDGTTTENFAFFMDSTAPDAPALVTPVTSSKQGQPVAFTWKAVTDSSGVAYTIEISQDQSFATLILEHTGLTTATYTMTSAEKLKTAGSKTPYYWRVQATDAAGNVSGWSTANTFTIGFMWPSWIIYVWGALAIIVALIFGLWLGRRMAYQSY